MRLSAEQGDGAGALLYVARYVGGAVDEGPDVGALRAGVVAGVATRVSSRELAFGRKVTQKSVPWVDCGPHCAEPRSGARSNARSIHRPTAAILHGGRGCSEGLMAVLFRCKVTNKIPQGQIFFRKGSPAGAGAAAAEPGKAAKWHVCKQLVFSAKLASSSSSLRLWQVVGRGGGEMLNYS